MVRIGIVVQSVPKFDDQHTEAGVVGAGPPCYILGESDWHLSTVLVHGQKPQPQSPDVLRYSNP